MRWPMLTSVRDVETLVEEIGFLPFFANEIRGFSVEELTPPSHWFVDGVEGPWEWKEQIADKGEIVYAKLFKKRAGYVSREWYPDLCNFRRDGYDFEGFYEDGHAPYKSKEIIDLVEKTGPMLSQQIKEELGYVKGGKKGFETVVTTLQMQTFLAIDRFVYKLDRHGKPYGWGVAKYCTAEQRFGEDLVNAATCEPEESLDRILTQLRKIRPEADVKLLDKWIR